MPPTLACGYLRAYRPLEAFAANEREQIVAAVRDAAGASTTGIGLLAPGECQEVYVTKLDGRTFVCPAQTRLRTMVGMVSFAQSIAEAAVGAFFSERSLRDAHRKWPPESV